MGDLISFEGYENITTPFNWNQHNHVWKSDRRYLDFEVDGTVNISCQYPDFWDNDGYPLNSSITAGERGCRQSDFDQYGDMPGVGAVPIWISQLAKFSGVQDRLRLWRSDVLQKVNTFSCMQIAMLDIDGFRVDKALQTTVEVLAEWAQFQRQCARRYGKKNFQIVGEAVGERKFASIYYGRGKQPNHYWANATEAQLATNETSQDKFLREPDMNALDGAAFHYPTYGAMTRFLGLEGANGSDGAIGFEGVDFAQHWNQYLLTDDMINPETGSFDPRHQFGMTNQDTFRWPGLADGIHRQILGFFITFRQMPGTPMLLWGEEQAHYVLENLAADYVFGRGPMASSRAWQLHGRYKVGASMYHDLPFDSAKHGCHDDSVSLDHRDRAHPIRNLIKRIYELRQVYPVFNGGFTLKTLSTQTHTVISSDSGQLVSPLGLWSVYRGRTARVPGQDFSTGLGNQGIWLLYHNQNATMTYTYDCNGTDAIIAAFPAGTTVRNLFYPYENFTLGSSAVTLGIDNSSEFNGCLPSLLMQPWEFKAFVPIDKFVSSSPVITEVTPRHDSRFLAAVPVGEQQSVFIQIQFSRTMSCDAVTNGTILHSTTAQGVMAQLNRTSVRCEEIDPDPQRFVGDIGSIWQWSAELVNVPHGVHTYSVSNVTTADSLNSTNAVDTFMFRIGAADNPMVFPTTSNYTTNLIHRGSKPGEIYLTPKAAGADKWRYSTNWGSSYSPWLDYTGENATIDKQAWSGTREQQWSGTHIETQYWSDMTGSADHVQHADLEPGEIPRRWPHAHVQGPWNQFGYDGGLNDNMK